MALRDKTSTPEEKRTPRWQLIMNLPENEALKYLPTGRFYKKGSLKPIHVNEWSEQVDTFEVIGTDERLDARMLRAYGDGIRCSLRDNE